MLPHGVLYANERGCVCCFQGRRTLCRRLASDVVQEAPAAGAAEGSGEQVWGPRRHPRLHRPVCDGALLVVTDCASAAQLGDSQTTMRAGRRPSWWQWVAAAWAVRRQSYPAVRTELPVRFDLAAAFETLLDELVKFFMELQE